MARIVRTGGSEYVLNADRPAAHALGMNLGIQEWDIVYLIFFSG